MTLKQRFQVMRSGSFSDVAGAKSTLEAKRKRWLNRSGSLRLNKGPKVPSNLEINHQVSQQYYSNCTSPLSSPETERRGSLPIRDRSLDRVMLLERRGSYQPYCNEDEDSGKMSATVKTVGFVNR